MRKIFPVKLTFRLINAQDIRITWNFIAPSPPHFWDFSEGRGLWSKLWYAGTQQLASSRRTGVECYFQMVDNWALTEERKNALIFTVHISFLKMFSWQKVGLFCKVLFLGREIWTVLEKKWITRLWQGGKCFQRNSTMSAYDPRKSVLER